MKDQQMSLKAACCTCLTELVLNDTNAQAVVQANGVYYIGLLMLPQKPQSNNTEKLQACILIYKSECLIYKSLLSVGSNAWTCCGNIFIIMLLLYLQANAFRAQRFLFSMERNRALFKRLFPPTLFEKFIDIGHYNRDIDAYKSLVKTMNTLPVNMALTSSIFNKSIYVS